jgi:predicted nucleic acid-binding protein
MIYILDASVIIKWFIEEKGTKEALAIKKQYEDGEVDIIEPDLLIYEVANVLRYSKYFSETAIKTAIKSLYDMRIKFFTPSISIMNYAIHISLKTNLSIYDSVYTALSIMLSSPLITADKKLYSNTKHFAPVKLIE